MPWQVEFHRDQEFIEVVYSGETSATDIRDGTKAAISLVKEHQVTCGLVNCLEQTATGSILELYELPSIYDDEGLTRDVRIAFVEPADEGLHELAVFYETVCMNRGWQIHRFATRDDAIGWLQSGL